MTFQLNKTDAKVEGYLIRAVQVVSDFCDNSDPGKYDIAITVGNRSQAMIEVAKMIQREENPPIYVMGNQIEMTGKPRTYVYVDDHSGMFIDVSAPDFESAIPLVIKRAKEQYQIDVPETLVRASMTKLE